MGKLIPFWVLALVILTVGLIVARFVYGIVPVGSYATIFFFAGIYLVALLGLGLLLSTYAQTQQQAFLVAFFILMIFILLSGLFTPIESMPYWAQVITWFNPVAYFYRGGANGDIKRKWTRRYQKSYICFNRLCGCIQWLGDFKLQQKVLGGKGLWFVVCSL